MGIAAYNAECRAIVMRYASEWETVRAYTSRGACVHRVSLVHIIFLLPT